jgi:hypothetical protein
MIRKLVLVAVVASAGAAVAVRRRKGKDEVDLWHEATTAPDLR